MGVCEDIVGEPQELIAADDVAGEKGEALDEICVQVGRAVAKDAAKLIKESQLIRCSARATKARNCGYAATRCTCPRFSRGSSSSDGRRCCRTGRATTAAN